MELAGPRTSRTIAAALDTGAITTVIPIETARASGKVSFAVLIIGALARSEGLKWQSLFFGFSITVALVIAGIMIDHLQKRNA